MSSEAITQNDLREILSRTVGSIPSEYKKLLWTNPSTQSAFSSQYVYLDLSNYDAVGIDVNMYTASTGEYHQTFYGRIGENLLMSGMVYQSSMPLSRLCEIRNASILFNDGYANTPNNQAVIPIRIYGIKYERVAPPQLDASDYVIEQGTEGIWTYRKWDSGIAECWAATPATSKTVSTSYGAGYYAPRDNFVLPSGLFTSINEAQASLRDSNAIGTWFSLQTVSTTEIGGYIFSITANTITVQLYIHAIGKWK